jgi:nucleoside-diphosphate-sugar epimerase
VAVVVGDLDASDALDELAADTTAFIHLAGVTFPRNDGAYQNVNVAGAARAAAAAAKSGAKFVHASSMSAREPHVSPYAQSKRDSESAVSRASGDNAWIALRLPAIYGPGDHATLPYFRLVKAGLAMEPATETPARASLLYARDAARALYAAATGTLHGGVFEVGDETPNGREWREIGQCLADIMDKKARRIRAPRPLVAMFHNISRMAASIRGIAPDVRTDQVNEFFHPDWAARDNLFGPAAGWAPETPLEEGFAKTARWYQDNALL